MHQKHNIKKYLGLSYGNHKAYLLFGGNLGDVKSCFQKAENLLPDQVRLLHKSKLIKTAPWRMENAPDFLNQVWAVSTSLYPHQLLNELLEIEEKLGRKRNENARAYESRIIDIDILFFEDLIINDVNLKVPHPRFSERMFAVEPMVEIAPDFVHPIEQRSIKEIHSTLKDKTAEALI